jgi:hypothetical protein
MADKYVEIKSTSAPKEDPAPSDSDWKQVTIRLTKEQVEELKALGIDTSEISIVTYDIRRLGDRVAN